MKLSKYKKIEKYMKKCMSDSAHDTEHVYRVLYCALDIAKHEQNVDTDILITACLLHDIGRHEQFLDSSVCHARAGAKKAYKFLLKNDYSKDFAKKVSKCIKTHRYRTGKRPESIEAMILFDADKVDIAGGIGIARTLLYNGKMDEPLYNLLENGDISNGKLDKKESFFREYKFKLEGMYSKFYTKRGEELAKARQKTAISFYEGLLTEMQSTNKVGRKILGEHLS